MVDFIVLKFLFEFKNSKEYESLTLDEQKRLEEITEFVSQGKDIATLLDEMSLDTLFEASPPFAEGILQFKITLKGSKPPILRRIQVDSKMNFHELHEIIQIAMGWTNSHLYSFEYEDTFIEQENDEMDFGFENEFHDIEKLDSEMVIIGEIFTKEGQICSYTYDYGDNWGHTIKLEKILPDPEPHDLFIPRCIMAKHACPPEDCGGIQGYYQIIESLSGPNNEKKKMFSDWNGNISVSEKVDIDMINKTLNEDFS